MESAERFDERVLRKLFGPGRIAHQPDDDTEDGTLVPADQLTECLFGSPERTDDQISVRGVHRFCSSSTKLLLLLPLPFPCLSSFVIYGQIRLGVAEADPETRRGGLA